MRKVFVLLVASLVVMLAMSLMFTSVVSAARVCKAIVPDCSPDGTMCGSAIVCEDKFVGDTCGDGKICVEICHGMSLGTAMFACCGCCPEGQWCNREGECVPEASTLILLATGLLFLTGYVRLKRRKTK